MHGHQKKRWPSPYSVSSEKDLLKKGIARERLEQIHALIGLDLAAEMPDEKALPYKTRMHEPFHPLIQRYPEVIHELQLFFTALTTICICSSVSSGYMGNETM